MKHNYWLQLFKTIICLALIFCCTTTSIAQTNITKAEYFVDTDPGFGNATNIAITASSNIANHSFAVDLSTVAVGFHNLFVRSKDANGKWSITNATPFLKTASTTVSNVVKAEYFIDTDPGFGNATNIAITASSNIANHSFAVDLSSVAAGFHNLYVRSKDANGKWSITNATPFLKTASTAVSNVVKAEYFIDTDPGFGNANNIAITASNNISNHSFVVDLSSVAAGFHNLYVRSKDANGKWSITNATPFLKTASTTVSNVVKAEYFIDTDPGFGNATNIAITASSNIANHSFAVDLSSVATGFHNLYVRSKDANGKWSVTNLSPFYKTAGTALSNIVKAEYFINNDPGFGLGKNIPISPNTNIDSLAFPVNIRLLPIGLHRLFIRSLSAAGKWSITNVDTFRVLTAPSSNIEVGDVDTTLCAGDAIQIPFEVGSNFNAGNVFTAQLSDINGGFNTPINIGTITSITTATINATIPNNVTFSNNYRVRVISSDAADTSLPNDIPITINVLPSNAYTISGNNNLCVNTESYILQNTQANTTYTWSLATGGTLSATTGTNVNVAWNAAGNHTLQVVASNTCGSATANTLIVAVAAPSGNPATYGSNQWNVYCYNGNDINVGSSLVYRGMYSVNTLNLNSETEWDRSLSPSAFVGYQGCSVNNDNFTWVYKRQGFATGNYIVSSTGVDDQIKILVNGVEVYTSNGFAAFNNITLGQLDANSEVEIRCVEATGTAYANFTFAQSNLAAGVIGSNQTGCQGFVPALLANSQSAFGGSSTTINYQWQQSSNNVSFTDIASATSTTYQPTQANADVYYRRKAFNANGEFAFSDTVLIDVTTLATPTITISSTNNPVCLGCVVTITATTTNANSPIFSFYKNGVLVQNSSSNSFQYTALQQDTLSCVLYSTNTCKIDTVESNTYFVTLNKVADLVIDSIVVQQSAINPKGKINVVWKVKNIGKLNSGDGWQERISLENAKGESIYIGTAYHINTLDSGASVDRTIELQVPKIVTLNGNAKLKIVVVPNANTTEPSLLQSNNTAYNSDSILVNTQLFIESSKRVVEENDPTIYNGYLFRSGSRQTAETFILRNLDTSRLNLLDTSITIGAGLSGAAFRYKAKDNNVINIDSIVVFNTNGNVNYAATNDTIHIIDNELISLSISLSKDSTSEGDTMQLTLVRQIVDNLPLTIALTSSNNSRFVIPNSVNFLANQSTKTIDVIVNKTTKPVLDENTIFTASANRYTTATDNVIIRHSNIPVITLDILPNSFSESAGVHAAIAKVKRQGSTEFPVTLTISNNSNGEIYYPTSSITLAKNQSEAQFFISVLDNNLVDSSRTVTITASVFVTSCGCLVSSSSNTVAAGYVSKNITILDNDGPSLGIALSETNLPEGKTNASVLTVTRNTTTTQPLAINIFSNRDSQLVYNQSVTIPIGSNKIDVPISVLSNNVSEGDRIVTFQANATGFAAANTWAIITDRTLPDATITLMPLSFDSAFAKSTITVKAIVSNEGVINIPVGTGIAFSLQTNNGIMQIGNDVETTKDIAPAQKDTITITLQLPDVLGATNVLAKVNSTQAIAELSYINNASNSLPLTLLPNYNCINVATNKAVYIKGDSIIVTGKAQALGMGISVANVPVDVYFINNQFRDVYSVTTDASGNFRFSFVPLQGQLGYFSVGACYPNLGLTTEQANFELLGLRLTNNDFIKWEINLNDTLRGSIKLINPSASIPLTNLHTVVNSISNTGWTLTFDSIASIGADDTVNLNYTITSNKPTAINQYEPINFTITSAEGASLKLTSYFYCKALSATLQSNVATIQTTMTKGATKFIPIVIKNIGSAGTGNITTSIPNIPWMSLQTPVTMPNLNTGDSQTVVLELSPSMSMPANVPVVGTIAINCEHGNGLVIPFSITPVSTAKGSLKISVEDEYTYFTANRPLLKGALVKVNDIYTNIVIAQGVTDSTGTITFDSIPDGAYKLNVTAVQHDSYQNSVLINAGELKSIRAFLSFQAISYTWTVVPTAVKDTYNIVSTLTFVTNVPAPVVILSMPDSLPNLQANQIFTFKATLTNKGFITAKNVDFVLPKNNQFEFVYNYTPTDILANQSIQIPVLMRLKPQTARSSSSANKIVCEDLAIYYYGWQCDTNKILKSVEKVFYIQDIICPKVLTATIRDVREGIPVLPFAFNPTNGTFGTFSQPEGPPYVYEYKSCDTCLNAIPPALVGCTPGPVANTIGCGLGFDGLNTSSKSVVTCLLGYLPHTAIPLCVLGAIDAACVCKPNNAACKQINDFNDGHPFNPSVGGFFRSNYKKSLLTDLLNENIDNLTIAYVGIKSLFFWSNQVFNDIELKYASPNFYNSVEPFITNKLHIPDSIKINVKNILINTDITNTLIDSFVNRWNNTIDANALGIYVPDSLHPNIIDTLKLHYYDSLYRVCNNYAIDKGFGNLHNMLDSSLGNIKIITSRERNSVCASVKVQFSQTVTMTRQAFRGTFTMFNGNTTDSIKNFKLDLVIKDDQGNIAGSNKFQVNAETITKLGAIDGTGTLSPSDTGSATILFIPTKNAAPTVPKQYLFGGSISYLDPFTGTIVTRDLYPVTITVNPSPDLVLDYFVQRDILGDDPLTAPIESSEPAEFSMIINNQGYGNATQVQFTTDEPQIVDNQKGLLINMNMVGSSLNGTPKSMAFNNLDFGTINARSTMYGQWYFTSSLLGQFVNYDVNVTHVSSYNNPDLSLISAANIHALVHTINVPSNDSSNPLGFLSTDIPNIGNNPDMVYVTDGTKQPAVVAQSASISVINDSTLKLTVLPFVKGWNYKSVINPFTNNKTLKKAVKENNNVNVSLRNVWLTDRTLFEGQDPIYENRIHFADDIQDSVQSYILTFNAVPTKRLAVDLIAGIPDTVATVPVTKVTVHFNKAINVASFTPADVTLRCQGVVLDSNNLIITRINDSTFELDITALTDSNGYYSLTVQTATIIDNEGFNGAAGIAVGWNQFANNNLQITTVANPVAGGTINPSNSSYPFGTAIQLIAQSATGYKFKNWTINNTNVSADTALNHLVIANQLITANFEKKKCLLNVVVDTAKGITVGTASGIYEFGDNVNLSVSTKLGYSFLGWKVNDVLISTNTSITFNIDKDVKLEPSFKTKLNPSITWNTSPILTCTKILDATVLNATSSTVGSFVYTPALGTTLINDSVYKLLVQFTPNDLSSFNVVLDSIFVATDFVIATTNDTTITSCDSVLYLGVKYISNTILRDTIKASEGCDSVYNIVHITVKHSSHTTINTSVCSSQLPFTWNGVNYNTSGVYTFTTNNSVGCDSVATLYLTVKNATSSTTNFTISSSQLPFTWNGLTFTAAGTQTAHLTNAAGCDSAATLNLTVNTTSCLSISASQNSVCVGGQIQYTANIAGGTWSVLSRGTINSSTGLFTATYAGTSIVTYTLPAIPQGCSTKTATLNLTVNALPNIPSLAYAPGTSSPQTTSVGGVIQMCTNKTFTLIGNPANGVWSKTGNYTASPIGSVSTNVNVNTGGASGMGSITYTVTNSNGCSNSRTMSANIVVCGAKGLPSTDDRQLSTVDFVIYPNPAKNVLNIAVTKLIGDGQIILTNMLGKQVATQALSMGNSTIDISNLAKGTYFVSVITNEGKQTKKLVVE